MSGSLQKQELRLFVSSTFRDLVPEREELVKKTFPRIRKACRERGVEFTEIDLRWGITEEESRTGRTIRICLEEIDRCRPYFIGILGSRYGWIPGITEVEKDEEMIRQFPWLIEYAEKEKSIIEMEFAQGALLAPNDSAFFYEQMATAAPQEDELARLKLDLVSAGLPYRRFQTPDELSEQVFQDILAILDRDFPAKKEMTPLEHERIEHEAYSRNRLQSYIANPEYYEIFEQRVNSTGAPLIIWGKSGLGKSALMAYLAHEYRARHPEAFVVQHFIGAAEGSDPEDVMRQVMMEIKERYHLSDPIPSDDNALREEFPVWLAKIGQNPLLFKEQQKNPLLLKEGAGGGSPDQPPPGPRLDKAGESEKLILFIDALNQLTGIAPEMHWLPDFIPENVRLILSTTTDSLPLEELRKRKWKELELKPLTVEQRERIATDFLDRYAKSLPAEELRALAENPKSSSPLFLRTVLEELRIFGHYQSLHDELSDYLSSADERELFQKVLARMERDHGAEAVQSAMTAIWASRHGLSESELMEITGKPRMALSELMIAMEYHLMTREGFHTFFHNYLREAIERRYLSNEDARHASHARIGEYFSTREYAERRRDEEPWQWLQAGKLEKACTVLSDEQIMVSFVDADREFEWLNLWHQSGEHNIRPYFEEYLHSLRGKSRYSAGHLLIRATEFELGVEFLTPIALEQSEDRELSRAAINDLSEVYSVKEDLESLEKSAALLQAMCSMENEDEVKDLCQAKAMQVWIKWKRGEIDSAEAICQEILALAPFAGKHEFAMRAGATKSLGALLFQKGHAEEALSMMMSGLRDYEKAYGANHPTTLQLEMNIAFVLLELGRIDESSKYYEQIIELSTKSYGDLSFDLAIALSSYAGLHRKLGNYEKAIPLFDRSIKIREAIQGSNHPDVQSSRFGLKLCRFMLNPTREDLIELEIAFNSLNNPPGYQSGLDEARKLVTG